MVLFSFGLFHRNLTTVCCYIIPSSLRRRRSRGGFGATYIRICGAIKTQEHAPPSIACSSSCRDVLASKEFTRNNEGARLLEATLAANLGKNTSWAELLPRAAIGVCSFAATPANWCRENDAPAIITFFASLGSNFCFETSGFWGLPDWFTKPLLWYQEGQEEDVALHCCCCCFIILSWGLLFATNHYICPSHRIGLLYRHGENQTFTKKKYSIYWAITLLVWWGCLDAEV